jgi:hypothetical protein
MLQLLLVARRTMAHRALLLEAEAVGAVLLLALLLQLLVQLAVLVLQAVLHNCCSSRLTM